VIDALAQAKDRKCVADSPVLNEFVIRAYFAITKVKMPGGSSVTSNSDQVQMMAQ